LVGAADGHLVETGELFCFVRWTATVWRASTDIIDDCDHLRYWLWPASRTVVPSHAPAAKLWTTQRFVD
jgi:hypothetical protein